MTKKQKKQKSVQELEMPNIDMSVKYDKVVEDNTEKLVGEDRVHVEARDKMPEKQLFDFAVYKPQDAEKTGYSQYSYWKSVWKNFIRNRPAVIMSCIFIVLLIFTFVALGIAKYDVHNLRIDNSLRFIRPNSEYWFGTDNLGCDYWCRVWYGTRTSIALAISVAGGEIIIGVIMGLIWGYCRRLDRIFTEIYNFINNIPTIIYLTLIALMVGKSVVILGIALVAISWLGTARNIRNLVLMYRDREYNLASRCLGTPLVRILWKNIFPYMVSVIVLRLALAIPSTIAYETTLTYLGLMDLTMPSLGILLRDSRSFFMENPYILIFPAAIVSVISITFYLVGNAFSDACDPRNHV